MALAVLAAFIALGIVFDMVGVAVTAADPRPFHSMAAHKEKGGKEAIRLLKNANQVSSFCNDVVGDICGIVSGSTAAVIVTQLQRDLSTHSVLLSIGITALISGITIGGKALGKTVAINDCTNVVYREMCIRDRYNRVTGADVEFFQMINTQGAVVLGMVYNYLPFMILPIYSVIIKLDRSLIEAARDLGANSVMVFRNCLLYTSRCV